MNDTVRLGRLAGVKVGLNWSLLVMVAFVAGELAANRFPLQAPGYTGTAYGVAGALTAVVLLLGVLLHELGHAVVAGRFRMQVDGITLSWMGGVTRIEGDARSPGAELGIAGIGPIVSLAFGAALWVVRILVEGGRRRAAGRVSPRMVGRHQRGAGRVQHAAGRSPGRRPGPPRGGLGGNS